MTRRWIDDWDDLEPEVHQNATLGELLWVIALVGGGVVLSAVTAYWGLGWLLGAL